MQIKITNQARNDITKIYKYISKDSPKYAKETVDAIYLKILELKQVPFIGRYVPEFLDKQYRELLYKSYRIVYDISKETNTIFIHFVVHCKRDFNSFYKLYIKK